MEKSPIVREAGETGHALNVLGTAVRVLASRQDTGSYEVTLQEGPEGTGPPPHAHPWDEAFFVLDGELEFTVGGVTRRGGAGTFVHVPGGTPHTFRYGAGGGRMLELTSPGGSATKMFGELDAELDRESPDPAQAVAILERNGARLATPPE